MEGTRFQALPQFAHNFNWGSKVICVGEGDPGNEAGSYIILYTLRL